MPRFFNTAGLCVPEDHYTLPPEHAAALADEDSPAFVIGGFQGMTAAMRAGPKVVEAFRNGRGVGWHEHDSELFEGTERFFRPGYKANLVGSWIPALDDHITFGVHSDIAEHYGVEPTDFPPDATTIDYVIAAAAG